MQRGVFILCLLWNWIISAQQNHFILIDQDTRQTFYKKDSLSAAKFLDSLVEQHYYLAQVSEVKTVGDSVKIYFDKGKNYNHAQVKLSPEIENDLKLKSPLFTRNLDSLKQALNQHYINEGFAFSRVKTKLKRFNEGTPEVYISLVATQKRVINDIKIKGYTKLPRKFVDNLKQEFVGKTYQSPWLNKISKRFQNHTYVNLERPPQTLFTADSTQVFLFLQKRKSNSFDGVLGFGNNQSDKLSLNGSLNFTFKNIFNAFESIHFFWQKNPNQGQNFNLDFELPYIAKTNIGAKLKMDIYRQDSTFATVKVQPSLYYLWKNEHKLGTKGYFELSSVLQKQIGNENFSKKGLGLWYQLERLSPLELMMYDTKISADLGWLSAEYPDENSKSQQWQYYLLAEHNFYLNPKHILNLKGELSGISTSRILSFNELLRFGGWNSLRGFNEHSLLGKQWGYLGAEYRYVLNHQAFVDGFVQLGQLMPSGIEAPVYFYSFGTGFRMQLPIGIMSFHISSGSPFGEVVKFKDTKIHWGILTRF